MFKQILKIIWNERKPNAWLFFELMIGFTVLWFCADYLYFITKRINEPLGKNIDNVYQVRVKVKPEVFLDYDNEKAESVLSDLWTIYDRIKSYPGVEAASVSRRGSYGDTHYNVDSVTEHGGITQFLVDPEYFDVFKLNLNKGRFFNEEDVPGSRNIIISGNYKDEFFKKDVTTINKILGRSAGMELGESNVYNVVGVVEKNKEKSYKYYSNYIYHPLSKNDKHLIAMATIYIRVSSNVGMDFSDKFVNDMYEQISIGTFYLSGISDVATVQDENIKTAKEVNERNSMLVISFFLIFNVFLGVLGTFWLKIDLNRKNIGLRRAVGASKFSIKSMFFQEAMILLFIAVCLGFVLCFNIVLMDVFYDLGIPQARNIRYKYYEPMQPIQYWINSGLTLLFLIIVICISVWYPAKKAADIPPAGIME
ncbi:ABC transporter permease, partial [Bacteroidales bacterium OttesenSCG-928-K03]|nr:ABC transporter permease [Bacteroidales bacterium OttesenSCG-928-L14]MDL2243161.1 ABC transporter permease [Bacteroidales bacterium OttesenSCG-928-K03]